MSTNRNNSWRFGPVSYSFCRNYCESPHSPDLIMRDRLGRAKNLFRKDLKGHFGCVNALEFSNFGGEMIISGRLCCLFTLDSGALP